MTESPPNNEIGDRQGEIIHDERVIERFIGPTTTERMSWIGFRGFATREVTPDRRGRARNEGE